MPHLQLPWGERPAGCAHRFEHHRPRPLRRHRHGNRPRTRRDADRCEPRGGTLMRRRCSALTNRRVTSSKMGRNCAPGRRSAGVSDASRPSSPARRSRWRAWAAGGPKLPGGVEAGDIGPSSSHVCRGCRGRWLVSAPKHLTRRRCRGIATRVAVGRDELPGPSDQPRWNWDSAVVSFRRDFPEGFEMIAHDLVEDIASRIAGPAAPGGPSGCLEACRALRLHFDRLPAAARRGLDARGGPEALGAESRSACQYRDSTPALLRNSRKPAAHGK